MTGNSDQSIWRLPDDPASRERRAIPRVEDSRLVTGRGRYAADQIPAGALHAHFVRSPHAHAEIRSIDIEAAVNAPGVVAVYIGRDLQEAGIPGLPARWNLTDYRKKPMVAPVRPLLCVDRVRLVGDAVAVVVAKTREQAASAAEAVEVEYRELAAAGDIETAVANRSGIWPEAPDNLCCAWENGDRAAVRQAMETAKHIFELDLINNRVVMNPMEPRTAVASVEGDRFRLIMSTQNPHAMRSSIASLILKVPEHRVQIVCADAGGGFGGRTPLYPEEATVMWAASQLNATVAWTSTRQELFVSDIQGRDHVTWARLGTDEHGNFMGLEVRTLANMGAYLSQIGHAIATYYYTQLLSGVYKIPAIHAEVRLIFSNTAPIGAYRGAGRPEASYVLERLVDKAAEGLGLDRIELRRRNFIKPDDFPYRTPVGVTYDVGDHDTALTEALQLADFDGFEGRRRESETHGKLRGFGIASYLELAGGAPGRLLREQGSGGGRNESALVRVHPSGSVSVFTPMQSAGQGHATVFAQLVADRLGLPLSAVEIVQGDTDRIPYGRGTAASRSLVVGGSAIARAVDKIVDKGRLIAASLMQKSLDEVVFREGAFREQSGSASIGFTAIAKAAYEAADFSPEDIEPGLEAIAFYEPDDWTFPGGCYICELEVDPATGAIQITQIVAVDDVGTVINPPIVHGQIHGGLAQGMGQAMMEHTVYESETAQLLTSTFMDYAMPRADDLPFFKVGFAPTYTNRNPFGAKGVGEVGSVGLPPAIVNAALDALRPLGVRDLDMPLTPHRVWQAIQDAPAAQSGSATGGWSRMSRLWEEL